MSADQVPVDIAVLQAQLAAMVAERDAAIAERDEARSQNDRLRHLLQQLRRMHFGPRSEKLDPDQLALAFEDIEQAIAASEAVDDKRDKAAARIRADKRRADRGALPAHLPRVHVTIEPEDKNCSCCRSPMHVIGEESSQRLDVIPAQFRVIVTHRPKYACRACEQAVVQAPAPERLIKGGLPTEAMVAAVLVAKYAWHSPLYRQAQMLASHGIDIKRSVLAFWVGYAATEVNPLYLRLRELILTSSKIAVDETIAPVLDPGRGRVKKGYFWAIARDDRPWGGPDPPAIAFTYAPGRGAVHALKLLDRYRGVVQCDGYAAYKSIAATAPDEAITLAFCWAHYLEQDFIWSSWRFRQRTPMAAAPGTPHNTDRHEARARREGRTVDADAAAHDVECRILRGEPRMARGHVGSLPITPGGRMLVCASRQLFARPAAGASRCAVVLPRGASDIQSAPRLSCRPAARPA